MNDPNRHITDAELADLLGDDAAPEAIAAARAAVDVVGAQAAGALSDDFTQKLRAAVDEQVAGDVPADVAAVVQSQAGGGALSADFNDALRRKVTPGRRWLARPMTRAAFAAAAVLVLGALGWALFLHGRPTQAYSLADIPRRMREVGSIYLRGFIYHRTGPWPKDTFIEEPKVIEQYVARPGTSWKRVGMKSGETHVYMVRDGRYLLTNTGDKEVHRGAIDALAARFLVEARLADLTHAFVAEPSPLYTLVERKQWQGREVLVYELRQKITKWSTFRHVLWFDPSTGLPVRADTYLMQEGREDHLRSSYDIIQANQPPPPGMFDWSPPEDYKEVGAYDRVNRIRVGGFGDGAEVRILANVNEQAVLICWSEDATKLYDGDGDVMPDCAPKPEPLAISSEYIEPIGELHYVQLRDDTTSDGRVWRWGLVAPPPGVLLSQHTFTLAFGPNRKYKITFYPLQLDDRLYEELAVPIQALTLNEQSDPPRAITLRVIEGALREHHAQPAAREGGEGG